MTELKVGDRVDITIKNVPVTAVHEDPDDLPEITVYLECAIGGCPIQIPHHWPMVKATRLVPAEWPPEPGDLWRDKHGELWFIHKNPSVMSPEPELLGRTTGGARWTDDMDALMQDNAPLALIHRESDGREES